MTITQGTVKKAAYPARYLDALKGIETRKTQGHNLGLGAVKRLRKEMENPVAILKSGTQKDSFVVFTKMLDRDGNPVMSAVHLNKDGSLGINNEVASAYGKKNYEAFISNQRKEGNVLYENKKIGLDDLPGNGLQLPELGDKSDPMNTLHQYGGKVKSTKKHHHARLIKIPVISKSDRGQAGRRAYGI